MNYSRRKVNQWYRSWDNELAGLSSKLPVLPKIPQIRLQNPNDIEAIVQLREYFTSIHHWEASQTTSTETYGGNFYTSNLIILLENEFKKKLLERLCAADLDRARLFELEQENEELRQYNSKVSSENTRLHRDVANLHTKLSQFEGRLQNERRREELERREREKNAEAIGKQREALKNVADVLENPSSPSVTALRKKFSSTKYEEEINEETSSISQSNIRQKLVRNYGGNGRGVVYNPAVGLIRGRDHVGFANSRYNRRSRSAGAGRVLNHEPLNRIPNGTVFQQHFPRNAKHTTKPKPADLEKCTDYIVTNQDVDLNGTLSTQCFKVINSVGLFNA
jgi:hypothetical protein